MTLTSPDFEDRGEIPRVHTCEGADRSPALTFSGVPAEAKSLALVVEDPDAPDPAAPKRVWIHWLLYNLPPTTGGLPGGAEQPTLPRGTREGLNDWKHTGYGGPCPPIGRHRYFFRLYALDRLLPELPVLDRRSLDLAMKGHLLGTAELMGTYQKRER